MAPGEEARRLANKEPHAWRLSLAAALAAVAPDAPLTARIDGACVQVDLAAVGDPVLARKDVGVAYHLACVVDDAEQGVTHIIRGDDLRHAVPVQRLLQTLLGLPSPAYHHHELLLRPDGKRYAKRDAAETLRDLRARGETAKALVGALDQERLTRANGLGAQASEQRGGFFQGDEQSDGEGDAHAQPG